MNGLKMVLEHQGLPNFSNAGLQPALQLYAAAAAHLAPRNRVPPWAPFLQFGVPGVFGSPFLTRPRFGPAPGGGPPGLAGLNGLNGIGGPHQLPNNRTMPGPPSEDSNEDRASVKAEILHFVAIYGYAAFVKGEIVGDMNDSGLPEENYPEFHYHLPHNMTFLQQVWNTFTPLFWNLYRHYYYLPKLEAMIRPALSLHDMPKLSELDKSTSLILTNTHYSEEYPRSLPPWIVLVGGMHCNDNRNPLPDKIQKFIDKWNNGFIYFSFGTYMRLPLLPKQQKDAIFGAIKKFSDIGIIMKWNGGPIPEDLPNNVFTAEWLDQQDILANPKARAFISHGGLLGTQEAIYHNVPIIVFPIFAEQDFNAQRIHATERGIQLEISDLTEEKLVNAIRDILTNKKYQKNIEKVSHIFRDRPDHPVDTAVWWVEYVLRHKNTSYLRPVGVTRTWYEIRMLHIWAFVAVAIGVFLTVSFFILGKIISKFLNTKNTLKIKQQ